jgi:hypothetical protein
VAPGVITLFFIVVAPVVITLFFYFGGTSGDRFLFY